MPRTKISKNSKRNRQATNDELTERLKEIDSKCDELLSNIDLKFQHCKKFITNEFENLRLTLPKTINEMKFGDLLELVRYITKYLCTCYILEKYHPYFYMKCFTGYEFG